MATEKKFKVVGVSCLNGEYKVRFANDIMRIKVLAKKGHTDIRLAELDDPQFKFDAVMEIKDLAEYQDESAKYCIESWIDSNRPKTATIKADTVAVTTEAESEEEENEDCPF